MYEYFENKRTREVHKLVKSLIPSFLLLLRKKIQYRYSFPNAFIDVESSVSRQAEIGEHCTVQEGCLIGDNVSIGSFTTLGTNCNMNGKGHIQIGKFCSIAPECLFWSENHVIENISTYPFEHFKSGKEEDYKEYIADNITIGNDVWVGQRVTILPGVHIGDGCVIAAGAVVPKGGYPPYSVIAGIPAKVIKKRLPENKVEELLALKWWDKSEEEIFGTLMPFLHQGK